MQPAIEPENNKFFHIFQIIGAFFAFCIGPRFTSGQESIQFFITYSHQSFVALGICAVVFTWGSTVLATAGHRLQLQSSADIFRYYCGPYFSAGFVFSLPFLLFAMFLVMIASIGFTLEHQYNLPAVLGRGIAITMCCITAMGGLRSVLRSITVIGIVLALAMLILGILGIAHNPSNIFRAAEAATSLKLARVTPFWPFAGFLYASFTLFVGAPFFLGLGKAAKKPSTAFYGAFIGAACVSVILACVTLGLLANLFDIYDNQLPTLALLEIISPTFALIFPFMLLFGVYSSSATILWAMANQLVEDDSPHFHLAICILGVISFAASALPLALLETVVYPFSGFLGIFFLGFIARRKIAGQE